jgi:hypothetical protein
MGISGISVSSTFPLVGLVSSAFGATSGACSSAFSLSAADWVACSTGFSSVDLVGWRGFDIEPDFAAGFMVPLVLGAEAGFAEDLVLWGIGLASFGLSWVFEAEAAVGRIMRSRKLSEGAAVVFDFLGAAG